MFLTVQLGFVRFDRRVNGPEADAVPPDQAGYGKGLVVARDHQRQAGPVRTHVAERGAGEVHVDVRCGQDDVADLGGDASVTDGHLPQAFQRQPVAHGVREHGNLADVRVFGQVSQQGLQPVAGEVGAFPVVAVGEHRPLRRPGEQDRGDLRPGIVGRSARSGKTASLELVVEAVHEHQDVTLGPVPDRAAGPGCDLGPLDGLGSKRDEIRGRIARQGLRPLYGTGLARGVRRDGDRKVHVGYGVATLTGE